MKITIIGAGNMGGAIARGLAQGSIFQESDITVTARSQKRLDELKAGNPSFNVTNDNPEAVKGADIVVLAIKPWLLESVIEEILDSLDLKKQLIVSVVVGVTFDDLVRMLTNDEESHEEAMGNPMLYRVIPNTAIAIRESMTLISSFNTTEEQDAMVKQLFDEMGKTIFVEERLMGAGTALCSCGIAYVFKYIQAAMDAAIELGFNAEQAREMVTQTVKGGADVLLDNGALPQAEIYKVTTPGGITIKGLNAMDDAGFASAVRKGIKASVK